MHHIHTHIHTHIHCENRSLIQSLVLMHSATNTSLLTELTKFIHYSPLKLHLLWVLAEKAHGFNSGLWCLSEESVHGLLKKIWERKLNLMKPAEDYRSFKLYKRSFWTRLVSLPWCKQRENFPFTPVTSSWSSFSTSTQGVMLRHHFSSTTARSQWRASQVQVMSRETQLYLLLLWRKGMRMEHSLLQC